MEFPQQLVTQISVPNNVPFAPGYDVIGIGTGVPQPLIDAGYPAAIIFYSSDYSATFPSPQIKYQFIAVKDGIINFGYAMVANATVSQVESIVIYEAHGYTSDASQSALDYTTTGFVDADSGSIDNLSVATALYYQGTELTTVLNKGLDGFSSNPKGIVAFGSFTAQPTTAGTTELPIFYLDWTSRTNRLYKIRTGALYHQTAGQQAVFRIRTTGNGSTPTITSGILCSSGNLNQFQPGFCDEISSVGAGPTIGVRMVLTMQGVAGAVQQWIQAGQGRIYVEDMGQLVAGSGGTSPAVPSNYHSFNTQVIGSRSYYGNGVQIPGTADTWMYQGDIHDGNGNRRSWGWFDPASAGTGSGGSLNDMVGVSAANIDYLQLYLYYTHWYYVDSYGGSPAHNLQDCRFGWHNQAAVPPGNEAAGGFPNLYSLFWTGRNVGFWIDIKGTSLQTAMLNGSFKGIVLGNTGSADYEQYGYANGAGLGNMPRLKAGYYK